MKQPRRWWGFSRHPSLVTFGVTTLLTAGVTAGEPLVIPAAEAARSPSIAGVRLNQTIRTVRRSLGTPLTAYYLCGERGEPVYSYPDRLTIDFAAFRGSCRKPRNSRVRRIETRSPRDKLGRTGLHVGSRTTPRQVERRIPGIECDGNGNGGYRCLRVYATPGRYEEDLDILIRASKRIRSISLIRGCRGDVHAIRPCT